MMRKPRYIKQTIIWAYRQRIKLNTFALLWLIGELYRMPGDDLYDIAEAFGVKTRDKNRDMIIMKIIKKVTARCV